MRVLHKICTIGMVMIVGIGIMTSCKTNKKISIDPEVTNTQPDAGTVIQGNTNDARYEVSPLVVGCDGFEEKFSPFLAESVSDKEVVAMTQISLLTKDRTGGIIYHAIEGETSKYNGKEYTYNGPADIEVHHNKETNLTTYTITIRADIKYSDGELMDADDLIFTYYAFADAAYQGTSKFGSLPIVGMKNYEFNSSLADETIEKVAEELAHPSTETAERIAIEIVAPILMDELEWVKTLYGKVEYAELTTKYPVAKDLFAFLYNTDTKYDSLVVEEENTVLADITTQYGADYIALGKAYEADFSMYAEEIALEVLISKMQGGDEVLQVAGIKKIDATCVEVTTKGFNPTDIYEICEIPVIPMHYYGDEALYNYDNNMFGFERGNLTEVLKKTAWPMGAGPYQFMKYGDGTVYFEANDDYYKGSPKTRYLQVKTVDPTSKISGVGTDDLDIVQALADANGYDEIKRFNTTHELSGDVVQTNLVDDTKYGYIGINAERVKLENGAASMESKYLRKALATVFSVYREAAIAKQYGEGAAVLNYPVSATSWVAPSATDTGYLTAYSTSIAGISIYGTADVYQEALAAAVGYLQAAGYGFDKSTGKCISVPAGAKNAYEIMIATDDDGKGLLLDIVTSAKTAFQTIGIELTITEVADGTFLETALNRGEQELWCQTIKSGIEPNAYNRYHSDNVLGAGGSGQNYFHMIDPQLDNLLMEIQSSEDKTYRKATYKTCFDTLLDWAVEIPVFQRKNCILLNSKSINLDTVTPDFTAYWNWVDAVELIQMKEDVVTR